jgi:hypothetical protein
MTYPPSYGRLTTAAAEADLSTTSVRRMIARGDVKARKVGRALMVDLRSLRAHLESSPLAVLRREPGR